jgi:uncharacterized protein (TIGR03382 family)
MRLSPATLAGVALALSLAASSAHADPILWTYNWSRSPGEILADAPGTGKILLTDEKATQAAGSSDIVATNLSTQSTATAADPDVFTHKDYTLSLAITDTASGQTGVLTFTGYLWGTLTAQSANIHNQFTGPQTLQVVLGQHLYTVTLGSYTQPGPPSASNKGAISGHADVSVFVQTVPEPSGLVLAVLGMSLLGLSRRRRPPPLRPA